MTYATAGRRLVVAGAGGLAALLLGSSPAWGQQRVLPGSIDTPRADSLQRNPFKPFIVETPRRTRTEPLTPLERYELLALQLVAIIYSAENPRAMVEDQSGVGYTVSVGTRIGQNDGVVTEILPDRVVVEETYYDFLNQPKQRTVELLLEPEGEGERSP